MNNKAGNLLKNGWKFIWSVFENFDKHECSLRAASLAYFALFSIVPLLSFLIYLGSTVLTSDVARENLDLFLGRVLPINPKNLEMIISQALIVRSSIGIVGAIGLLWSASSVFGILEMTLSVIWNGNPSPFWRRRGLAAVSVLALSFVFIASFSLKPLTTWLWAEDSVVYKRWLNLGFSFGLNVLTSFLVFRIFPNRDVYWKPALAGAIMAASLIEIAQAVIGYYIGLAFTNFGFVYGSLAWIVVLGFWAFLVGLLFFFGAEFGATLEKKFPEWRTIG